MRKTLVIISIIILVILLVVVLILGYLGFVPGISTLFGSDKPLDLGVRYTEEQFREYNTLAQTEIQYFNTDNVFESIKFSDQKNFENLVLGQELISARLNYSQWKYMPLKNIQIRLGDDGRVEVSANLQKDKFIGFLNVTNANLSKSDLDQVKNYLNLVPVNPALYIDSKVTVVNNQASIKISKVQLGKLDIDINSYNGSQIAEDLAEKIFQGVPEFYGKKVEFLKGSMNFTGSAPTKIDEARE